MSALGNIIRKEIRELMTPATFLPIIIMALIFGSMGNTIGGIEEQLEGKPVISLINADQDNLSFVAESVFYDNSDVVYNSMNLSDLKKSLQKVKDKDGVALIVIQNNFTENIKNGKPGVFNVYWVMKGAGLLDSISSSIVETMISRVNTNITMELISKNQSINASTALTPTYTSDTTYFKGTQLKNISPAQISNMLSQQSTFIPVIMMIIIIMAGQIVISSMAMEKENKTLETLLTLPVKRTSIVSGKIIASAIIGLILAVIYMIGLSFYMQSFQIGEGATTTSIDLSLSGTDYMLVGLSIFVALIAALAFCMLLGTLAKNYKSAQTLTFPVAILVLIPMFITMFKDFDTLPIALKAGVFAIPFSHPMMAPRALMFNDYTLVISGIIYVLIFALIMISIVVWIFKTDRLLTGSTNTKLKKLFKK